MTVLPRQAVYFVVFLALSLLPLTEVEALPRADQVPAWEEISRNWGVDKIWEQWQSFRANMKRYFDSLLQKRPEIQERIEAVCALRDDERIIVLQIVHDLNRELVTGIEAQAWRSSVICQPSRPIIHLWLVLPEDESVISAWGFEDVVLLPLSFEDIEGARSAMDVIASDHHSGTSLSLMKLILPMLMGRMGCRRFFMADTDLLSYADLGELMPSVQMAGREHAVITYGTEISPKKLNSGFLFFDIPTEGAVLEYQKSLYVVTQAVKALRSHIPSGKLSSDQPLFQFMCGEATQSFNGDTACKISDPGSTVFGQQISLRCRKFQHGMYETGCGNHHSHNRKQLLRHASHVFHYNCFNTRSCNRISGSWFIGVHRNITRLAHIAVGGPYIGPNWSTNDPHWESSGTCMRQVAMGQRKKIVYHVDYGRLWNHKLILGEMPRNTSSSLHLRSSYKHNVGPYMCVK